jgi:Cys-tRNA(Pro)/Cys-tRNA(Cys) deacylase
MAKQRSTRGTQAVQALEGAGVPFTLHPYEPDPAEDGYGLAAARALGVDPGRVFKTLIVSLAPEPGERPAELRERRPVAGGGLVVALVPVDKQLDLKALARAAGAKSASLADPALAERITGYVVGGISPLGQRHALRTFVDDVVVGRDGAMDRIYFSAGRRGLQIEVAARDLLEMIDAKTAPLARN